MFGGAGIYRDGLMFGLVAGDDVYLKADDETRERFREAGCRCFVYEKDGKTVEMSYWSVPDEAMDDPELLRRWADLACGAALRAKRPKRRKTSEEA
jgi:DNA transformation protein